MTTREALESERAQLEALLDDDRHVEATPAATVRAERARLRELRHLLDADVSAATAPAPPTEIPPYRRAGLWEPLPLYPAGSKSPPPDVPPEPDDVPVVPPPKPEPKAPPDELDVRRRAFSRAVAGALEGRQNRKGTRRHLRKFVKECPFDLWCLRVLGTALEAVDGGAQADQLRPSVQVLGGSLPGLFSFKPLGPAQPAIELGTESPDLRGVTPTQDFLLRTLAELGPPGAAEDVESVVRRARESRPELDAATIQSVLVSLAHPARRRFPLVDAIGLVDRNAPERTRATRVRLSAMGREFLAGALPLPLLLVNGAEYARVASPPYNPGEVLSAAIEFLSAELERRSELHATAYVHGPDLPTGGELRWRTRSWRGWSGDHEPYLLSATLELEVENETQRARLHVRELPWPMTAREVIARAKQVELPGLEAISDESTCEGQEVLLEFEHVAFAAFAERAFVHCDIASQASPEPFRFPHEMDPSVGALVRAFVDARRAATTARLEQSLAERMRAVELAEGVVIAVRLLEDVLRTMRTHDDEVEGLMGLRLPEAQLEPLGLSRRYEHFTEAQARHVASVRRLPSRTLESALQALASDTARVEELRGVLASPTQIAARVRDELVEAAARFQSSRRTRIIHDRS